MNQATKGAPTQDYGVIAIVLSLFGLGVIGAPLGLRTVRSSIEGHSRSPGQGLAAVWIAVASSALAGLIASPISALILIANTADDGRDAVNIFLAVVIVALVAMPIVGIVAAIAVPMQLKRLSRAAASSPLIESVNLARKAKTAGITYLVITSLSALGGLVVWLLMLMGMAAELNLG